MNESYVPASQRLRDDTTAVRGSRQPLTKEEREIDAALVVAWQQIQRGQVVSAQVVKNEFSQPKRL